jgi:hypothetical protein
MKVFIKSNLRLVIVSTLMLGNVILFQNCSKWQGKVMLNDKLEALSDGSFTEINIHKDPAAVSNQDVPAIQAQQPALETGASISPGIVANESVAAEEAVVVKEPVAEEPLVAEIEPVKEAVKSSKTEPEVTKAPTKELIAEDSSKKDKCDNDKDLSSDKKDQAESKDLSSDSNKKDDLAKANDGKCDASAIEKYLKNGMTIMNFDLGFSLENSLNANDKLIGSKILINTKENKIVSIDHEVVGNTLICGNFEFTKKVSGNVEQIQGNSVFLQDQKTQSLANNSAEIIKSATAVKAGHK